MQSKIDEKNPWYINDQLQIITNEHQKRTIRERWMFFDKIIRRYRFERQHEGGVINILDAGCGDGVNLKFLVTLPDVDLTAFDYNPLRVAKVRENFRGIRIILKDLTENKNDGQTYDVIICSQVLEHIKEDVIALRNLKSLLAPGGVLILGVPNEGCILAQIRNNFLERHIAKTTDHVHFYTMPKLKIKFETVGLVIFDTLQENFFFPLQRMNNYFASRSWGFACMKRLQRLFPSQCGGFYLALAVRNRQE